MEAFGRPARLACELYVCLMETFGIVFVLISVGRPLVCSSLCRLTCMNELKSSLKNFIGLNNE